MKTDRMAKMEKLIDEIKNIASYKSYMFVDEDRERLKMVLEEILDYEREENNE